MDVALHPVPGGVRTGGHRVIVASIADQRRASSPGSRPSRRLHRALRQRQHRRMVALEAFPDRLGVSAQPPLPALPALRFQMRVQLIPTVHARNGNHEVPPGIADQSLHLALVVALGRSPELIGEQIMALQLGEGSRLQPLLAAQNPSHRDLRVVVENARGTPPK